MRITAVAAGLLLVPTIVAAGQDASGSYECSVTHASDTGSLLLSCTKTDATTAPAGDADYQIVDVRRYRSVIDVADWLEFRWRAMKVANRYEVTVKFQQGAFFTTCTETWYDPEVGAQRDETSIPDVCGADDAWSSVTIEPADGRVCDGCGTFLAESLPVSRTLAPASADPTELQSFIDEIAAAAGR